MSAVGTEVSAEFSLRLAPVKRGRRPAYHSIITPEEVEFELEASASGHIVSLHRHGPSSSTQ
jgi:hypothetical protein